MQSIIISNIPEYFGLTGFILWAVIERYFYISGLQQTEGDTKDKGTYYLISICWYTTMLASFLDAFYFNWTPRDLGLSQLRWLGIPLIMIGLAIRIVARKALGEQYSARVETSKSHQLITNGIYSRLRHPAYLGSLSLFVGIPLSLWSIPGLAIALLGGIPAIFYRISIEEKMLAERFGEDYSQYCDNTWKLLPFIW